MSRRAGQDSGAAKRRERAENFDESATPPRLFQRIAVIAEFLFARSVVPGSGEGGRSRGAPPSASLAPASEITARYGGRAASESFISDFSTAEARKSDTRPLSRNFGRLIITSRREDSRAPPTTTTTTTTTTSTRTINLRGPARSHKTRARDESVFPPRQGGRK